MSRWGGIALILEHALRIDSVHRIDFVPMATGWPKREGQGDDPDGRSHYRS